MRWSNEMISGMNCDYITLNEKRNVRAYFCTPEWWGYRLEVYFGGTSSRGNEECIDIEEPEDGDFVPVSICKGFLHAMTLFYIREKRVWLCFS